MNNSQLLTWAGELNKQAARGDMLLGLIGHQAEVLGPHANRLVPAAKRDLIGYAKEFMRGPQPDLSGIPLKRQGAAKFLQMTTEIGQDRDVLAKKLRGMRSSLNASKQASRGDQLLKLIQRSPGALKQVVKPRVAGELMQFSALKNPLAKPPLLPINPQAVLRRDWQPAFTKNPAETAKSIFFSTGHPKAPSAGPINQLQRKQLAGIARRMRAVPKQAATAPQQAAGGVGGGGLHTVPGGGMNAGPQIAHQMPQPMQAPMSSLMNDWTSQAAKDPVMAASMNPAGASGGMLARLGSKEGMGSAGWLNNFRKQMMQTRGRALW